MTRLHLDHARRETVGTAVSRPDDRAEQQADHAADTVALGGSVAGWSFAATSAARSVSRSAPDPGTTQPSTTSAMPNVEDVAREPGRPLAPKVRQPMEARFGSDFSQVRIHDDAQAAAAANAIGAKAFTVGHHIGFAHPGLAGSVQDRQHLLAHELAHVAQHANTLAHVVHREPTATPATQEAALAKQFASWATRLSDEDIKKQEDWISYNVDRNRDPHGWQKLRALRNERSDRARETAKPVRLRGDGPARESAQGAGSETSDSVDRRVETVRKAAELFKTASKYSEKASWVGGRYAGAFEQIHEFSDKWGKVIGRINHLDDAELAYDVGTSFVKLARTKPGDSEALAQNAGEAFHVVGQLMKMTHLPLVGDYGEVLISTRNFFSTMRTKMDPATNVLGRHPEFAPALTGLGGPQ